MNDDERALVRHGSAKPDAGEWFDGFAVCASVACMAHCLGLPLVLAALPAFADRIDPGESFHAIVLLLAVPTSAFALVGGWRRHRAFVPMLVGVIGLALMAGGIAFAAREALETGITVAGSLLLASAHIANWRLRKRTLTPCSTSVADGSYI